MEVVGLLSGFFIQEHLIKNMKDFYKILGIKKGSEIVDIKKAFREKALKYHPDINKSKTAISDFRNIVEAYETLQDPKKRNEYDKFFFESKSRNNNNSNVDFEDLYNASGKVNESESPPEIRWTKEMIEQLEFSKKQFNFAVKSTLLIGIGGPLIILILAIINPVKLLRDKVFVGECVNRCTTISNYPCGPGVYPELRIDSCKK